MSNQTRIINPVYAFFPTEIEGFDKLAELALDMRCSWSHFADELWSQLDPDLWESTHNPWVVLQTISRDQLQRVLADPVFRNEVANSYRPSVTVLKRRHGFRKTASGRR